MGRDVGLGGRDEVAERCRTGDDAWAREALEVELPVDLSGGLNPLGSWSDLHDDGSSVRETDSDHLGKVARPEHLRHRRRGQVRQAPAHENVVHRSIVASDQRGCRAGTDGWLGASRRLVESSASPTCGQSDDLSEFVCW